MIYLINGDTGLDTIFSSAATVDVNVNYIDAVISTGAFSGGGRTNTAQASAATTTVCSAPAASTLRTIKQATWRNKDASLSCDVTVRQNTGTACELIKMTLAPGETLIYLDGVGFWKIGNSSPNRLLSSMEGGDTQRIFASRATEGSTFLTISGTAYYVYVGRVAQDLTVKFVEFQITTAGAGTDTKEVGLFSTPAAPNKSAQTLTKIVATGTVDAGTSTGAKRNTTSFAQLVSAGTHLWAAIRCALATTQPTCVGLANDMGQGHVLTTTGGGALTGLSTASGGLVTVGTATLAPALRVTLD